MRRRVAELFNNTLSTVTLGNAGPPSSSPSSLTITVDETGCGPKGAVVGHTFVRCVHSSAPTRPTSYECTCNENEQKVTNVALDGDVVVFWWSMVSTIAVEGTLRLTATRLIRHRTNRTRSKLTLMGPVQSCDLVWLAGVSAHSVSHIGN